MNDREKCQCTMSISMLGDGCRYCQPQEYIDRLHEGIDEDRAELDKANARVAQLEESIAKIKNRVCGESMPNWENTTHTGVSRGLIADECDNAMQLSDTWLLEHDKDVEVKVLEEVKWLMDNNYDALIYIYKVAEMIESRK